MSKRAEIKGFHHSEDNFLEFSLIYFKLIGQNNLPKQIALKIIKEDYDVDVDSLINCSLIIPDNINESDIFENIPIFEVKDDILFLSKKLKREHERIIDNIISDIYIHHIKTSIY